MERQHLYLGWMGHHKAELSSAGNINKWLCSFKAERGESQNKQGECAVCVCVCTRTWKEERRRGAERESREREIKAGGMFLNLCVGGGASPTQNALPHSLQPTQVFRSITFLCSQQIMILPLHQSSPAILRESWNGDLMWSQLLICDA